MNQDAAKRDEIPDQTLREIRRHAAAARDALAEEDWQEVVFEIDRIREFCAQVEKMMRRRINITARIGEEETLVRTLRSDVFRLMMTDALNQGQLPAAHGTTADEVINRLVKIIETGTAVRRQALAETS